MATEERVIYSFEMQDGNITSTTNKMKKASEDMNKEMEKTSKVVDKNKGSYKKYTSTVQNSAEELKKFEKNTKKNVKSVKDFGKGLEATGKGLTTVANGLKPIAIGATVAGGAILKTGIDFQSAVAGVAKTTDMSGKELDDFTNKIREMAKVIPMSTTELLEISEIAGQLGVRGADDLALFTETMAHLGVATNMTGEEASVVFGQISAITKLKVGEMPHLASAIVEMGNNSKTTERDIANMLLRLASGSKIIGISEQDMVGWATAIASTGMSAELGGSAFSRFGNIVEKAVATGGSKLEGFAKVAGMSADEFKTAFEQDASGALLEFVKGLENVNESGGSVTTTLSDLGLKEMGVSTMLKNLSGNTDDLTKYIDASNTAWKENTALTDEASIKYATLESQLKIIWNTIKDSLIVAFEALEPLITSIVEQVKEMAVKFNEFMKTVKPETIEKFAKVLLGLVGAIPVLGALGKAFSVVGGIMSSGFMTTLIKMVSNMGLLSFISAGFQVILAGLASAFTFITSPIGIVIGILVLLYTQFESVRELVATLWTSISEAFTEIGETIQEVYETYIQPNIDLMIEAWNNLMTAIQPVVDWLANALGVVLPIAIDYFKTIIQIALQIVGGIFGTVFSVIGAILNTFAGVVRGIGQIFRAIFQGDITGILNGFKTVFSSVFNGIGAIFSSVFNGFVGIAQGVIDSIAGFFTGLKDKVGGILSAINPFKSALEVQHLLSTASPFGSGGYTTNETNFTFNVSQSGQTTASTLGALKQRAKASVY